MCIRDRGIEVVGAHVAQRHFNVLAVVRAADESYPIGIVVGVDRKNAGDGGDVYKRQLEGLATYTQPS